MLPTIYLASQSPRRRELLQQIGVTFDVVRVDVAEVRGDESPQDYVQRLSRDKASAGIELYPERPVLGADTIVVLGEQVLEKPACREQGIEMLLSLSGQIHQVMTAVSLYSTQRCSTCLSTSFVHFRSISEVEAEAYWDTGEPVDKAGGYGIQGKGGVFVTRIEGSYSGIVGLPLYETHQLLLQHRC